MTFNPEKYSPGDDWWDFTYEDAKSAAAVQEYLEGWQE